MLISRVTTGVSNYRELVRRTSVVSTYSRCRIATRHHKEYGEVFRPLIRIKLKYERERGEGTLVVDIPDTCESTEN